MYLVEQAPLTPEPTPEASPQQDTPPPAAAGVTGHQHLRRALANGPGGLADQIRYIFALSQVTGTPPPPQPRRAPASLREARLRLLDSLSQHWSETYLDALIADIHRIDDPNRRLPLLARYYSRVAGLTNRREIAQLIHDTQALDDPAARAEALYHCLPLLAQAEQLPIQSEAMLHLLDAAQQMTNPEARLRSQIALLPHLPAAVGTPLSETILDTLSHNTNASVVSKALATFAPVLPAAYFPQALRIASTISNAMERLRALIALAPRLMTSIPHWQQLCHMGVEAIAAIDREDDRAEMLISFAPHLMAYADGSDRFPVALEKALALAVGFTRERLRAHTLVALAPHLPSELLGEALASVHTLADERERATLLAQLAPTLPPDMLVASLAVAHSMRERDSRVLALTALAHHVPPHAYEQTIRDALAAAAYMPNLYERVNVLMTLLDLLSPAQQGQALDNALTAIRQLPNPHARARAIRLVAPHLPGEAIPDMYALVRAIEPFQPRMDALVGLLPVLPPRQKTEAIRNLLAGIDQLPLAYQRARALINLIPHLDARLFAQAEAQADQLDDPVDQVAVFVTLVQYLPPQQRQPLIHKAWRRIAHIQDGYDRASAIASVAPFLPANAQHSLSQRIMETMHLVTDEYDRASVIILLAPLVANHLGEALVKLPHPDSLLRDAIQAALTVADPDRRQHWLQRGCALWLHPDDTPDRAFALWQSLAPALSALPLADVLGCLMALQPLIERFAAPQDLKHIAQLLGLR